MIEMHDTAVLMNSEDYKERFVAEYWQTKLRYDRLHRMVVHYEADTLEFKPKCSLDLLKQQKAAMGQYLYCLEVRAAIERITLHLPKEGYPSFQPGGSGYVPGSIRAKHAVCHNCTCEK